MTRSSSAPSWVRFMECDHVVGRHPVEQLSRLDCGLLGAGVAKGGFDIVVIKGVTKTVAAIFLSPAIGFLLALTLVLIVSWIFVVRVLRVDGVFRGMQFVRVDVFAWHTAATMRRRPWASSRCCSSPMAISGLSPRAILGRIPVRQRWAWHALWRLAHRAHDGSKNHASDPMQGFCAETGGAITLFAATGLVCRVDDHTDHRSIIGVGAARRVSASDGGRQGHSDRMDRHDPAAGAMLRCFTRWLAASFDADRVPDVAVRRRNQ